MILEAGVTEIHKPQSLFVWGRGVLFPRGAQGAKRGWGHREEAAPDVSLKEETGVNQVDNS